LISEEPETEKGHAKIGVPFSVGLGRRGFAVLGCVTVNNGDKPRGLLRFLKPVENTVFG
jgi:hypothetical protein